MKKKNKKKDFIPQIWECAMLQQSKKWFNKPESKYRLLIMKISIELINHLRYWPS